MSSSSHAWVGALTVFQNHITSTALLARLLPQLRLLNVAGNCLKALDGLQGCASLSVLDASHNEIGHVRDGTCGVYTRHGRHSVHSPGDLPPMLVIVNLDGNPCSEEPDFRARLLRMCPRLVRLSSSLTASFEPR
jgi:Leucine-rich repeat (LRR) protein